MKSDSEFLDTGFQGCPSEEYVLLVKDEGSSAQELPLRQQRCIWAAFPRVILSFPRFLQAAKTAIFDTNQHMIENSVLAGDFRRGQTAQQRV